MKNKTPIIYIALRKEEMYPKDNQSRIVFFTNEKLFSNFISTPKQAPKLINQHGSKNN